MATQYQSGRRRRVLLATALACAVLGILLLAGAWKWGWFGGNRAIEERVFDLGNGVRMTFCWCPPGTFLMGSPLTEAGRKANERQHEVTLTQGFWMAKTETTQAQWKALMPHNPSSFQGNRLPVDSVTWSEAQAFAAALTERLRKEGKVEAGWEFCLPTEVQWEYACRAGTTTAYSSGDGEEALENVGWYASNTHYVPSEFKERLKSLPVIGSFFGRKSRPFKGGPYRKSKPVGAKAENSFGLQDMHGNVWELCEGDWADQLSEWELHGKNGIFHQMGEDAALLRVVRGGSRLEGADKCRSAARGHGLYGAVPGQKLARGGDAEIRSRHTYTGFRVCLVPVPKGAERIGGTRERSADKGTVGGGSPRRID